MKCYVYLQFLHLAALKKHCKKKTYNNLCWILYLYSVEVSCSWNITHISSSSHFFTLCEHFVLVWSYQWLQCTLQTNVAIYSNESKIATDVWFYLSLLFKTFNEWESYTRWVYRVSLCRPTLDLEQAILTIRGILVADHAVMALPLPQ